MAIEPIDYLMAEDFEERFGVDAWSTPEIGWQSHVADVIQKEIDEGRLISITDEGMVMAGWRRVNITHRGVVPDKVYNPKTLEFLDGV